MGKGDKKTKKGKVNIGSFGVRRPKKSNSKLAVAGKRAAKPKPKASPKPKAKAADQKED